MLSPIVLTLVGMFWPKSMATVGDVLLLPLPPQAVVAREKRKSRRKLKNRGELLPRGAILMDGLQRPSNTQDDSIQIPRLPSLRHVTQKNVPNRLPHLWSELEALAGQYRSAMAAHKLVQMRRTAMNFRLDSSRNWLD